MKIFQIGDPVIRAKALPVSPPLGEADKEVIEMMTVAMRQAGLVGIAAPQVGVSRRIFLSEILAGNSRNAAADRLRVFINPEITHYSPDKDVDYEGCGSVADTNLFGEVERSKSVTVHYVDETGAEQTASFEGLLARIIQHEFDHLEGIVFTDKLTSTKTLMSGSEYRRMRAEQRAAEQSLGGRQPTRRLPAMAPFLKCLFSFLRSGGVSCSLGSLDVPIPALPLQEVR